MRTSNHVLLHPEQRACGFHYIPTRIGASESNDVQHQIQQLVPTDFDGFNPEVIISYATGRRPASDVEGAGPGMLAAAEVIKALFKSEIPCFSGLMTPAGVNWRECTCKGPRCPFKQSLRSIDCLFEGGV